MTVGTREPYMQHKEIKEAQGTKTAAQGVEHAIAGTSTYVVVTDEDVEDLKEAIKDDMQSFYMQVSTLGFLEALL
ncbi:eukaryotic translation initiation factor 5B-like [Hibiscus syriacus]|uniref:eukaryotic translation initiation factor 5B-like n=1 Tax=Hibiscus syriacus TaxID=106335 RepID=UPI001921E635|nr:eukaryotic translation initiation factor 5B-like [Hibiscus syriacus]